MTERDIQGLRLSDLLLGLQRKKDSEVLPVYLPWAIGSVLQAFLGPSTHISHSRGKGLVTWVVILWLHCWSSLDSVEFLQFNNWSTAQNQTKSPNGKYWDIWMFSSVFEHSNKGFLWGNFKNKLNIFKNWTFEFYSKKFSRQWRILCWSQWNDQLLITCILSM